MGIDDSALRALSEESADLQADALKALNAARGQTREIGASRAGKPPDADRIREYELGRRKLLKAGGFGLGVLASSGLINTAFGQRVAAIASAPPQPSVDVDIQIFQTASSLENLAVATYDAALGLPFIQDNAVVKAFAETTMQQHFEHGAAFKGQTEDLGGQRQDAPNPKYAPIVEQAKPGLTDAAAVVALAATLEEVATDTYLSNLTLLTTGDLRRLMASVMGVESQHLATLRAVGALLDGGAPELIAIPTDVAALPAAAGSVAFPQPFEEPDMASPPAEGALQ